MKKLKTTRREFLKTTALGTSALMMSPFLFKCGKTKQPNILFIMTDDHAYQAISCFGSKINQTPNIDRLAEEGMRFQNSFVTNSICAPSRAVLLTGKYSHVNGQIDNKVTFDGSQVTFPKLLQQAGYQTAMIGKWHLKSDPTGFDYWNILPGQGQYYNPDFIEMGERKNYIGYATDLTRDFGLQWLENRDKNKPFCLLLHHKAPHRNWLPDEKHLTMYDDVDIPMPETFYDDYSTRSDAARQQEMTIANHTNLAYDLKVPVEGDSTTLKGLELSHYNDLKRMTPEQRQAWEAAYNPKNEAFKQANLQGKELAEWKYQRYIKDYLRCIASVDDNIGRVLDYLEEKGLAENTIVVYTSDQGFYLGEHGWFDKRFMYEESLRMPLIVRYPKEIQQGTVNEDMVLNLDLAPTFLDFAGVKIAQDMQGRSLRTILRGHSPENWRESIYYHYYEYPGWHMVKRHYGIRTKRYKLIHFYYDIDAWEFYDLENDPHELNNLYDDPAHQETIKKLKVELEKLRGQYGDSEELAREFIEKDEK